MGYVYAPQITDLLSGCACAIIFILLLSLDARKAIKRKAYWLPGISLVLSALTLRYISFVDYSTVNVFLETRDLTDKDKVIYLLIQPIIDSGRLVICVFIAYLIPGLVSSRFRSVWSDIGALALTVLSHMLSEIYIAQHIYFNVELWITVVNVIIFTAIILLVLLCICTVLAGKTIRFIMNQKVPSLLSCCSNSRRDCGSIGDHVLKSWIVGRCSQPEYIMARSVLSSLAGFLVTVCVTQVAFKWVLFYRHHIMQLHSLNRTTFLIQSAFVLMGWIFVSFRWLTAVIYFPRDIWSSFQVEDFWTRSIIELKHSRLNGPLFREKRNRDQTLLESIIVDIIVAIRLHYLLLSMALLLQKLVVFLSKATCFLSWFLFFPFVIIRQKVILRSEFSKYKELLEMIRMPGEMARNLWIANESAFKSTKKHMQEGMKSGQDLMKIIRRLQTGAPEGGETCREEEKYLQYTGKKSWKMKAASLIHLMLCSYDDTNSGVVDDAFKACSEAWPLMDFTESSDTEDNFVSQAADKEFNTLENIWNKKLKVKPTQSKEVQTLRNRMIEDMKSRIADGEGGGDESALKNPDSMDWRKAVANFSLNRTSKAIDADSVEAMINNSRRSLANVIVDCLANELSNSIIEKCNSWAVDGKEQEIYHAAFIAGKAMAVSDLIQTGQVNHAVPKAVAEGVWNNAPEDEAILIKCMV